MIIRHLEALSKRKVILASASPRRKELLQVLGLKAQVQHPLNTCQWLQSHTMHRSACASALYLAAILMY